MEEPQPLSPELSSQESFSQEPLSQEMIEQVLGDFRSWLGEITQIPAVEPPDEPISLHDLLGQMTALRQEVNLQTKSTRALTDQTTQAIQALGQNLQQQRPATSQDGDDSLSKNTIKAILESYDQLALAAKSVNKQRLAIDQPIADPGAILPTLPTVAAGVEGATERPGFFARLFGKRAQGSGGALEVEMQPLFDWYSQVQDLLSAQNARLGELQTSVTTSLDSMLSGYQMSMNRLDRLIETLGLTPIACEGQAFDPERMEAMEAIVKTDVAPGTVVEEVRRGYLKGSTIFRYAQVKVAQGG